MVLSPRTRPTPKSGEPPSPPPTPLPGLTVSRLAPRRGKKQAKRNLPQLMTAARHQLRRAMPDPASQLRDWILQPPRSPTHTHQHHQHPREEDQRGSRLVLVRVDEPKPFRKVEGGELFLFFLRLRFRLRRGWRLKLLLSHRWTRGPLGPDPCLPIRLLHLLFPRAR